MGTINFRRGNERRQARKKIVTEHIDWVVVLTSLFVVFFIIWAVLEGGAADRILNSI